MRLLRLLTVLALAASPALAQEIPVRAGEHGAFTRLVLSLPDGAQWSLDARTDPVRPTVTVAGAAGFDTSQTFDRIDRRRIAAVTAGATPDALQIDLGCDCTTRSFTMDGLLVLDILGTPGDGTIRTAEESAPSRTAPRPGTASAPLSGARDIFSAVTFDGLPRLGPRRDMSAGALVAADRPALPAAETASDAAGGEDDPPSPANLQRMLAEGLADAATAGLLTGALNATPDPAPKTTAAAENPLAASRQDDLAATLIERLGTAGTDGRVVVGGDGCVPPDTLRIETWAAGDDPYPAISEARQRLFGEFDRLDQTAVLDLARTYLHFGFGAEARDTLRLVPDLMNPDLVTLSRIIDGEPDRAGRFARQTDCPGPVAMWAVLGQPQLPAGTQLDTRAILQAFDVLPRHLQRDIGPRLAQRMADAGETDVARNLLNRVTRAGDGDSDLVLLGNARLDLEEGKTDAARDVLTELAARAGPATAEAVVTKVDLAHGDDEALPDGYAELTAALAAEHRGTEEGGALWLAHQRTLLASSAFDAAFAELVDATANRPDLSGSTIGQAVDETFDRLTRDGSDLTFTKHALAQTDLMSRIDRPDLFLGMAKRLLDLGFAAATLDALDRSTANRPSERTVRAEALLALGRPADAEAALVGVETAEADAARARARLELGDPAFASATFDSLGQTGAATRAAWLAGDWQAVADTGQGTLADVARLLQIPAPDISPEPTLAGAGALADTSRDMRQTLSALLTETRIPETEGPANP